MAVTPGDINITFEVEDQSGQRSLAKVLVAYMPDLTASNAQILQLIPILFDPAGAAGITKAFAALTNAKVVKVGMDFNMDWANEPTGEAGNHKYVQEKAGLHFEDGFGGKASLSVPAPVDALFLTGTGMQTIVDPTSALISTFQAQVARFHTLDALFVTPRGGVALSSFFGGQLRIGKPPRRRRIQGV